MELASNALTTPERLRQIQPFEDSRTNLIVLLINQASGAIERELQRNLSRQSYSERITPSGSQKLLLMQWPIVSVEHVLVDGVELDPDVYTIENHGVLYKDDGWSWSGYPYGLAYDPRATRRNVSVVYTAGYVLPKDATDSNPCTLPADIEGLCIDMVAAALSKIDTGGNGALNSFSISDVRWDWAKDTPASWQTVIDQYKRWA